MTSLSLNNSSTVTTTAVGNVTGNVNIYSGSTLTLGADMTLSGNMDIRDTNTTVDMAGHSLMRDCVILGWYGGVPTLLNRGRLTASSLAVSNQTFDLNATDSVSNFSLSAGTSTLNTPLSGLYLSNNSTARRRRWAMYGRGLYSGAS